MTKRYFYLLVLTLVLLAAVGRAQDASFHTQRSQISGPANKIDTAKWLADIKHWRMERRIRIGYDDAEYLRPQLAWTQSSFVQPQMMIHDRFFFDPVAGTYTVDRYLDDLNRRYGGIDAVLVWQSYPNMGIDNRNQYDLLRDLPGGIAGEEGLIASQLGQLIAAIEVCPGISHLRYKKIRPEDGSGCGRGSHPTVSGIVQRALVDDLVGQNPYPARHL